MKINLKSQKGSITLFVLAACLFFIVTIASTYAYAHRKNQAVEKSIAQIKSRYEKDVGNEDEIYAEQIEIQKNLESENT